MLKERIVVFSRIMKFFDLVIVALSYYLSHLLWTGNDGIFFLSNSSGLVPVAMFVLLWAVLLHGFGMYESLRIKSFTDIFSIVFKAVFFGFFIFVSFMYMFRLEVDRGFIIFSFFVTGALIIDEKILIRVFLRHIRARGRNNQNILIVGTGKRAQKFIGLVEQHHEWGLKILGLIDEDIEKKGQQAGGYQVIGGLKDIPAIVHNNVVDEVAFVVPRSWLQKVEEPMRFLEAEGIRIHLAVDYFDFKLSRAKQTDLYGFPLLSFERTPDEHWQLLAKQVLDLTVSLAVLVLLAPLLLVIMVAIKMTSEGPVFFCQERCGLNGRKFVLYKFRTMVKDAENRLEELRPFNEMNGPAFKMTNDPRLTKIGKFLRKISFDELPQLWNVLKGDMSLIGPRPPLFSEVQKYDLGQRRRLTMKPGLSCLWQISGRNTIVDFEKWMKLDMAYIDQWSLWLDFKIFLMTIPVVLLGHGAK